MKRISMITLHAAAFLNSICMREEAPRLRVTKHSISVRQNLDERWSNKFRKATEGHMYDVYTLAFSGLQRFRHTKHLVYERI